VERVGEEVWGVVDFALNDMHCLARDCADDKIARKFVAPALELIMLDKAKGGFDRREALLRFGEMYATAIAGDGTVGPREVVLVVGGELGGGATLLRLAALHLLNELLFEDLKLDVHTYAGESRYSRIAAYGGDAARLMRLLAAAAPSAGGEYLSPKFEGFVEKARVEVRLGRHKADRGRPRRRRSDHIGGRRRGEVQRVSAQRRHRAPIPIDGSQPRGARGPPPQTCWSQRGGEEGGR
jgi:hypothetical protein